VRVASDLLSLSAYVVAGVDVRDAPDGWIASVALVLLLCAQRDHALRGLRHAEPPLRAATAGSGLACEPSPGGLHV